MKIIKQLVGIGFVAVLLITPMIRVAAQGGVGSVTGVIELDGNPLVGVEVFLGINPPRGAPGFEARSTCTDSTGVFAFHDVPLGQPLISVTGQGGEVPGCDNPKFVDPSSHPPHPLVPETLIGFGTVLEGDHDIGTVEIERLPDERRGLVILARSALWACYDRGNHHWAARIVEFFLQRVDVLEERGKLDPDNADLLRTWGGSMMFGLENNINEFCPA